MKSQTKRVLEIEADYKTSKSVEFGYLTGICYLAPAREADGVHNLCTFASKECMHACLYDSGMSQVFPSIKRARIAKTLWYLSDPEGFKAQLRRDIARLVKLAAARRLKPAVRINGTSDVPKLAMELCEEFPRVTFYDYTKIPKPWMRARANYDITFSFSGENWQACQDALDHGVNVAVVFDGSLPATWNGRQVIDGDEHDLRFLDKRGVIVGLITKGNKARRMETGGFIQIGGAK